MCQAQGTAAHLQVWWGLCVQSGRIKSWASVSHSYNFSKENQHGFHLLWKEAKPQLFPWQAHPKFPAQRLQWEWRRAVLVASQEGLFVIPHPHEGVALSLASHQIQTHHLPEMWFLCLKVYLQSSCLASPCEFLSWPCWPLQLKKTHELQLLCLISRQHWSLFW